ncbi:MAG: electron transport complex subunit RsxA [Candidatus Raymondbacteria bacterium RifOxyA12_full_50_37]|uniref:Ion-translocating oxidoreductase complex subunit A n=1 Tax=Candidatus Raymondbacteria bacterium RIFOXYD12_FULL_49_13 TaxID=1817890 RepID=A0A1F7F1A8_UNCRA|nr:MAG: electron transport complex subunit RsxA [Candidatus Raymondbacteria bacterium RifOxyA12_full_50_37]OGJ93130.1 MAG: electron transport complex subunit RsxA [Candidatus Raymondbacteria bacterium RifOxyB12_full_50_8]OGJ93920.1 MAG: electron transport complex subunit RsxA [Candidatus Raymondbacteria bacterium RIFOXYA2_FULL_49_16]OGJ98211.1 MAG: electron transport complex subunit RsxA [Candidatus Raymondbacteria bacterium RIFOXYC2_FULL_50_21]OGK00444.1 MAG: electron transport complex subunit
MTEILLIVVSAVLVNNFVLMQFLGICPFMGVSQKIETSIGMGLAVMFVMTVANALTWNVQHFILTPFGLQYLGTVSFILLIAALVQLVEIILKKTTPALYQALGIYLPLITTNCAVLGCVLLFIKKDYGFVGSVIFGLSSASGFTLALLIFSGIRERLEYAKIPALLKGLPITFLTAGLLSMAFMGFSGLVK